MADETEERSAGGFDWKQIADIAQRRIWYFLPPVFAGWLVVWAASWLMPSVYRSGTLILVEQPKVPQQFVVPNVAGSLQDRLNSITEQILSRTRLLHVIDKFHLYAGKHPHYTQDELVERMRSDIQIELVRSPDHDQLSSFNVYYSSKDPKMAQQVTSELTNLFIAENLQVRQQESENTTQFLQSQVDEARQRLAEQEARVRHFKDQHLGELPGQLQSNLEILNGLQAQLQSEQDALNRANQQRVYLQSLLGQYRSIAQPASPAGSGNPSLATIEQEIDRLRSQLVDMRSHYTDRHPDIRKLEEQIDRAEHRKAQLTANSAARAANPADHNGPDPVRSIRESSPVMDLESQLKANEIDVAGRQRAIADLKAKIGDYQARLNSAPVREQQFADINRDYEQSRAGYDSLLAKRNESELATNLEKRQQGEQFRVLDPPSLPTKPYSPNRLKLSGIGLFVGLLLGAGVTACAALADDRVYSEKEIKKLTAAQFIGDIPNLLTAEEKAAQQRQTLLKCSASGVVFLSILAGFAITYLHG